MCSTKSRAIITVTTPGSSWVKGRQRNIRKWRTIVIPCWISNIPTTQWMQTTRLLAQVQHEIIVFRRLAIHVSRSWSLKTAFIIFCSWNGPLSQFYLAGWLRKWPPKLKETIIVGGKKWKQSKRINGLNLLPKWMVFRILW